MDSLRRYLVKIDTLPGVLRDSNRGTKLMICKLVIMAQREVRGAPVATIRIPYTKAVIAAIQITRLEKCSIASASSLDATWRLKLMDLIRPLGSVCPSTFLKSPKFSFTKRKSGTIV